MYRVRSTLSSPVDAGELLQNQGSLLCLASLKGNASSQTYRVSCFWSASEITGVVAKNNVLLSDLGSGQFDRVLAPGSECGIAECGQRHQWPGWSLCQDWCSVTNTL